MAKENKVDDVNAGPGVAYGIYLDNVIGTQLSKNTVTRVVAGIAGKAYGIYFKNVQKASMNGDSVKGVAFGPQAVDAFLVYLESSKNVNMESVSVQNGGVGIGLYKGSTDVTSANMTFQGIAKQDIHVLENSILTVLNTTFDKFSITPGSKLRVQNFLHVKVVDAKDSPLKGMRVSVKDNKLEIANLTTESQGLVRWVVATNRIYFGDSNPKYNKTNARVLTTGNIYDKHPRDMDMNTSHTETFKVTATQLGIGAPSYRSDMNDTWNVSQATKFTLSINYSGPSTIYQYYSFDSGQYTKYASPFNLSGLSGTVKINYYSSDGSVNIETPRSVTVNLDATPPTTSYSIVGARFGTDPVYVSPLSKISLKGADTGGSGCARSYYSIDKVGWIEYKGPVELKNLSEGTHIFQYYSTDNVENRESTQTLTINIDSTPPTSTLTLGNPKYGTAPIYISEGTEITLNASDSASGSSATYYSIDSGAVTKYTGPFKISANGSHTIKYNSTDRLGNAEVEKSFELVVDTLAPTADTGKDSEVELNSKLILSGKASRDNVKVVNWTWEVTTPSSKKLMLYGDEVELTCNETGDYSVKLTVLDEVGHSGSDLIKVSVREKGTSVGSGLLFLLLIIILAVVVGAVIWYRILRQKKEKEEQEAKKGEEKKEEKKAELEPEKKEETKAKEEKAEGMKDAAPAVVAAAVGATIATTEKEITSGMNNLVLTSDIKWCYEKFKELMSKGAKGLCISTTQPAKLRIRYKVREASLYWLTDSSSEKDTLNPRRIEFEVTKTLLEFMKTNKGGVMFIDGLEYLIMENGFERVTRFIKKIGDSASKGEHTLIILLNPSALAPDPLTIMKKNFDEVIEK